MFDCIKQRAFKISVESRVQYMEKASGIATISRSVPVQLFIFDARQCIASSEKMCLIQYSMA